MSMFREMRAASASPGVRPHVGVMDSYGLFACPPCKSRYDKEQMLCCDLENEMEERMNAVSPRFVRDDLDWNLAWFCRPSSWRRFTALGDPRTGDFQRNMSRGQSVNQIEGAQDELSNKIRFCRNLHAMWGRSMRRFTPLCFVLPEMRGALEAEMRGGEDRAWAVKGALQSGGFSVRVVRGEVPGDVLDEAEYVQEFLLNPFLTHGRKGDFRLFTIMPATPDPLRVYVHPRGILRRTIKEYTNDTEDRMAMITNNNLAKSWFVKNRVPNFIEHLKAPPGSDEARPESLKWSTEGFLWHAENGTGLPRRTIWRNIKDSIALGLAAATPHISCVERRVPCDRTFHVFGTDAMVLDDGTSVLIEANSQPDYYHRGTILLQSHAAVAIDAVAMVGKNPDLPNEVDAGALRDLLAARAAPRVPAGFADWRRLGVLLREFLHRGEYDLAFPNPHSPDALADTLRRLPPRDRPVLQLFADTVAAVPERALRSILRHKGATFADFPPLKDV